MIASECDCCKKKIENDVFTLTHAHATGGPLKTSAIQSNEKEHHFCSKQCVINFLNDNCPKIAEPTEADMLVARMAEKEGQASHAI
jgi:hypothetical protein